MSPRQRSALFICLSLGLLLGGLYGISRGILLRQFESIEQDSIIRDVSRAVDSLANVLTVLDSKAGDWANWDETYRFMVDRNPNFLEVNPTDTSMIQLQINYMLLFDQTGDLIFAKAYDPIARHPIPVPGAFADLVAEHIEVLGKQAIETEFRGVDYLPSGPALVAARPILTGNGEGPSHGILVFGRNLDDQVIQDIEDETHVDLSLIDMTLPGHSADVYAAQRALDEGATTFIQTIDDRTIAGYAPLADISGHSFLFLQVESPRTVVQQGRASFAYFGLVLLGIGLVTAVVTQVLVDRLLLSRLARNEAEARYQAVVENAVEGMVLVDPDTHQILQANPAVSPLFGIPRERLVRRTLEGLGGAAPGTLLPQIQSLLEPGGVSPQDLQWTRSDGEVLELEASATQILLGKRRVLSLIVRDVTERNEAERALRLSEERYALASRGANDGLWDWDLESGRIHFSDRWKAILGFAPEEIGSDLKEWFDRVHPDDREKFQAEFSAHVLGVTASLESEHRLMHRDGTSRWVACRGIAVRDEKGTATRMAGSISDITDRKRAEERLTHDALHDGLTGLPNRALFQDRLERALERAKRHPELSFAVLFVDLDRFKVVNDSLGHQAGDALLVEVGRRLASVTRGEDTVARLGGDEFALLLEQVREIGMVTRLVERIQGTLADPFVIDGQEAFVTSSIGIAMYDEPYTKPEEILRDADIAMYRAKEDGGDRHALHDARLQSEAVSRLQRETELRRGLDRGEFLVYYQPVFDLAGGRIQGFEALARWHHPEHGLLLPAEFIPLSEESGLILRLGAAVLDAACRQLRAWQTEGVAAPDQTISVNVSSRQFAEPGFPEAVAAILRETELAPSCLILEITETVILQNAEASALLFRRLKDLGVQLSLDDFGTGYSALSYLHRFPLDSLKVDRSFVADLSANSDRSAIVGAIVDLAHNLRMEVVAEGIETVAQRDVLRSLDCEFGQGFLYAHPLPSAAAHELLLRTPVSRAEASPAI